MRHLHRFVFTVSVLSLSATLALAAPASYTLDPAQSVLSISGQLLGTSVTMTEQGPGSLSTSYSGTIQTDLDAGTITVLGGTLTAGDSGSWQPDIMGLPGTAPANYGGLLDVTLALVHGAVREFTFQAVGSAQPIVGGQFAPPSIEILSGVFDYLVTGIATDSGRADLPVGVFTNNGGSASLTLNGLTETLAIPVSATADIPAAGQTLQVNLTGTIVATRTIPEPSAILLLSAAGVLLSGRRKSAM